MPICEIGVPGGQKSSGPEISQAHSIFPFHGPSPTRMLAFSCRYAPLHIHVRGDISRILFDLMPGERHSSIVMIGQWLYLEQTCTDVRPYDELDALDFGLR